MDNIDEQDEYADRPGPDRLARARPSTAPAVAVAESAATGLRVEIEVVSAEFANFAMAHNRMSFLQRVTLGLGGLPAGEVIAELTVDIVVRDAHGDALSRPCKLTLHQLETGRPHTIDHPPIRLDPQAVARLEEEIPAEIEVSVEVPGHEPVRSYSPIRVLAARQWVIDPNAPLVSLELLAAFVQPNHPQVDRIVSQLGDRLLRATKDPSLDTANVGADRINAIVTAVCEAIHDDDISYAQPPASWGLGQKVRGLGEIRDARVGTCLDLTLAIASVLEHLGIAPVIWVAYGHAFLGWWCQPMSGLPDAASLQVTSAVNAVDLKLVGVVETTLLTRERRPPRKVVNRARQAPLDHYFQAATAELFGVVDVAMCRTMGVLPMPVRHRRDDGVVEIVEYHPAESAGDLDQAPDAERQGEPVRRREEAPVPPRVQAWKNNLLDLTLRNPLLNLSRVTQLPLLVPPGRVGELANLVQDGQPVAVRACDDLSWAVLDSLITNAQGLPGDVLRTLLSRHDTVFSDGDFTTHAAAIARLRYRARTARQETGANLLMLTLARLDWSLGDRTLSAPLLLMPVDLKGVMAPQKIVADPAGQVTLNLSLLEKLRIEFGFTVPELAELQLRGDGDGVDVDAVIRSVREAIAAHNLPFRVSDEARLAIIAFTGYLLWRDLDEHWERFLERPLVRHLALAPTEPFPGPDEVVPPDADLDALTAAAPIPADGSQIEAVAAAAAGRSFVLEGPPGTGKSQTITNVIADQLAHGRTVLFVAEKGAALDVVRRRLEDIGLLPFTLDLHSDNARPSEVRQQLKHALALRPLADSDGYTAAASDVTACSATLRDYARRLHTPNGAGLNLYAAHNLRLARGEGARLTLPATVADIRPAIVRAIARLAVLDEHSSATWGFATSPPGDPAGLATHVSSADAAVERAGAALATADRAVADALCQASTPDLLAAVAELLRGDTPPPAVVTETTTDRWQAAHRELSERTRTLATEAEPVLSLFAPEVLQIDLAAARQALRQAQASFFIGRKGRLLTAGAPVLAHLRSGAHVDPRQLPEQVEKLVTLAERHRSVADAWRALPGLDTLPPELNLLAAEGQRQLSESGARLDALRAHLSLLPPELGRTVQAVRAAGGWVTPECYQAVGEAARAIRAMAQLVGANADDLHRWAHNGLLQTWRETAQARAADLPRGAHLARWCEAATELEPLRDQAPDARWELLTLAVPPTEALAAYDRGIAEASATERFEAGAFDTFDPATHDRTVARFVQASEALRASLRTVLPAAVVGQRPFQPGRLFGTVAALEREIGRSRGGLSVRKLIQQYGHVIAKVTPCVLVSPDSLARFIPPDAMPFDLVVFDEASQITVADAIGALGRADAAVVAGDSKQMPPTAFAQLGSAGDDIDDTATDFELVPDEESILSEAVLAGLPRLWLSWHYRSHDESLIAFSNGHYYEGRLLSFPAVPGRGTDRGLSFTRVPGTFIRSAAANKGTLRTNPVEAVAVVEEVVRRWRAGERSIGVVTFNIQQRGLIEQLLAESGEAGLVESVVDRNDGVFVKNLENVQGDERDLIIFSTGFSAAENGVLPLNFGPLNRVGGERRLNVAVTRARRRVMVFSSFEPEDLRADQTSSIGVKHLRAYLELAKHGVGVRDPRSAIATDRHRDEVAERLRTRGMHVQTGLGLSDFQVDVAVSRTDGSPSLAVVLDSPAWASRRTTADRDGLPMTVLAGQGWPAVARVWLPAWLYDQGQVLDQLEQSLEQAAQVQHRDGHSVSWVSQETEPVSPDEAGPPVLRGADPLGAADPLGVVDPLGVHESSDDLADTFVPYEPVTLGNSSRLDTSLQPHRGRELTEHLRTIVEVEGPICEARLARHLVRCFGLTRLTDARQAQVRALIPADLRRDAEGFLWPAHRDPLTWKGYRRTSGPLKDRPLDEVAVIELANAIGELTKVSMGIPTDDLLRETIRVFGGSRVTTTTKPRLDQALHHAVTCDQVQISAGLVVPVRASR